MERFTPRFRFIGRVDLVRGIAVIGSDAFFTIASMLFANLANHVLRIKFGDGSFVRSDHPDTATRIVNQSVLLEVRASSRKSILELGLIALLRIVRDFEYFFWKFEQFTNLVIDLGNRG